MVLQLCPSILDILSPVNLLYRYIVLSIDVFYVILYPTYPTQEDSFYKVTVSSTQRAASMSRLNPPPHFSTAGYNLDERDELDRDLSDVQICGWDIIILYSLCPVGYPVRISHGTCRGLSHGILHGMSHGTYPMDLSIRDGSIPKLRQYLTSNSPFSAFDVQ